ncbi:DUF2742 domain-containing protein [Tsukamurella sp. USMM236]|uniref:DUF2742 domain-containing protein n=1 Tax=Tsukamurella sp. USMM236 TaxID=3081301 RepID=UPI00301750AE
MKSSLERVREWAELNGVLPLPHRTAHTDSTEVSFSAALAWAGPYLRRHHDLPAFGSPAWVAETDQRRKTAAAVNAALMWAIRAENRQGARIDASHEISEAVDWATEAQHLGYRNSASHIQRQTKGAA